MSSVDNRTLGIRSYRRIVTPDDPTLSRMQTGIGDNLDDLTAAINSFLPLQGGRLFRNITLTSGNTLPLQHLLGREFLGFIPMNLRATAPALLTAVTSAPLAVTLASNATLTTALSSFGDSSLMTIASGGININRPFLGTIQAFGSVISAGVQTVALGIAVRRTLPIAATVGLAESALLSTTQPITIATNEFRVNFVAGQRYTVLCTNSATVLRTFQSGLTGITIAEIPCDPSPFIDATSVLDPKNFIPLQSARNCIFDAWIF